MVHVAYYRIARHRDRDSVHSRSPGYTRSARSMYAYAQMHARQNVASYPGRFVGGDLLHRGNYCLYRDPMPLIFGHQEYWNA